MEMLSDFISRNPNNIYKFVQDSINKMNPQGNVVKWYLSTIRSGKRNIAQHKMQPNNSISNLLFVIFGICALFIGIWWMNISSLEGKLIMLTDTILGNLLWACWILVPSCILFLETTGLRRTNDFAIGFGIFFWAISIIFIGWILAPTFLIVVTIGYVYVLMIGWKFYGPFTVGWVSGLAIAFIVGSKKQKLHLMNKYNMQIYSAEMVAQSYEQQLASLHRLNSSLGYLKSHWKELVAQVKGWTCVCALNFLPLRCALHICGMIDLSRTQMRTLLLRCEIEKRL